MFIHVCSCLYHYHLWNGTYYISYTFLKHTCTGLIWLFVDVSFVWLLILKIQVKRDVWDPINQVKESLFADKYLYACLYVVFFRFNWFSPTTWFTWVPSSMMHLAQAETKLLNSMYIVNLISIANTHYAI